MTTTIKDLGEIELLNRLKKFMRCGQIDDDVAELNSINKSLLINTDLLVEKIHFSEVWATCLAATRTLGGRP